MELEYELEVRHCKTCKENWWRCLPKSKSQYCRKLCDPKQNKKIWDFNPNTLFNSHAATVNKRWNDRRKAGRIRRQSQKKS